jgi:hypothetical protein
MVDSFILSLIDDKLLFNKTNPAPETTATNLPDQTQEDETESESDLNQASFSSLSIQINWHCEYCLKDFSIDFKDQLKHQIECNIDCELTKNADENSKRRSVSNLIEYFCIKCEQKLMMTQLEILKHKKSHNN